MSLWESIYHIFNNELSNYVSFCLLSDFISSHPVSHKINNVFTLNFFINVFNNTLNEYSSVYFSRYYLLYKYRCACFFVFNYTLNNLDFIFNHTLHFDVILYFYDVLINDIKDYVAYDSEYNWDFILTVTTHNSPFRELREMISMCDGFFDDLDTSLFEDIIKEIYYVNPMIQEISLRKNLLNEEICMYSVKVGNKNLVMDFITSTITLSIISITFMIYVLMFFMLLLNFFKNKNFNFASSILNKINKIFEYDFGPNFELKFFILFISSIFLIFFFKNLNLSLNFSNFNDFFIFYSAFILFLCLMYPFIIILCMGIYFLTYIKGTELKQLYLLNFFFDSMAMISYFSRFLLQLVRLILFLVIYYMLHEYFYDDIINSIVNFYNIKTNANSYFMDYIVRILRFMYELSDFVMLLVLQSLAFFSVMFILFSFLFTSNIYIHYENFFKKKNI